MIPFSYDFLLLRIIIPVGLFTVSTIRYNLFSFVYFIFFLAAPLLRCPNAFRSRIVIRIYLIFLVSISCLFTLSHPILYMILAIDSSYNELLSNCSIVANISAAVGIQLLKTSISSIFRLVTPDPAILILAIIALANFAKKTTHISLIKAVTTNDSTINQHQDAEDETLLTVFQHGDEASTSENTADIDRIQAKIQRNNEIQSKELENAIAHERHVWNALALNTCSILWTVFLTASAGIIVPSLLSTFYLIAFLIICTCWSCRRITYTQNLTLFRISLLIYSALHMCLFYLYQFEYSQTILNDSNLIARLLGLNYLVRSNCNIPGEVIFPTDKPLFVFFAPLITLLVYFTVAIQIRPWINEKLTGKTFDWLISQNFPASKLRSRTLFLRRQQRETQRLSRSHITSISHDIGHDDCPSIREPLIPSSLEMEGSGSTASATTSIVAAVHIDDQDPLAGPSNPPMHKLTRTTVRVDSDSSEDHLIDLRSSQQPTKKKNSPKEEIKKTKQKLVEAEANIEKEICNDTNNSRVTALNMVDVTRDKLFPNIPQLLPLIALGFGDRTYRPSSGAKAHRPLLLSIHNSAVRNSYILTFISMMAWSVTFRSWLSFILLVSACILWIMPNSRSACLFCSPIIVFYGMCIILLQYIYCFNLTELELPTYLPKLAINLTEVGLHRWPVPVGPLALQLVFLIFFWLNVRLFVTEQRSTRQKSATRGTASSVPPAEADDTDGAETTTTAVNRPLHCREKKYSLDSQLVLHQSTVSSNNQHQIAHQSSTDLSNSIIDVEGSDSIEMGLVGLVDNVRYRKFTNMLRVACARYWIALCCLTMLLLSLRRPVVIFRISYMLLLLYFFTIFMLNYSWWRRQMLAFWWLNIVYSMAVLLCTYTYQFTSFPYYWQNGTGLSPQVLKAIGLEQFGSAELFDRMMMPVVFLVVIILQVHYFHKPFLRISSLTRFQGTSSHNNAQNNRSPSESTQLGTNLSDDGSSFMGDVHSAFNKVAQKVYLMCEQSVSVLWRIAEVYWIKIVCLLVICSVIKEVTITNLIPLIVVVICFPFPYLHGFLVTIIFIFTGLQIIMKMLFQLDILSDADFNNFSAYNPLQPKSSITSLLPNGTGKWIGLDVVEDFPKYITPLALLVVSCVIWHIITFHQKQTYRKPDAVHPKPGIIFPDMSFDRMDEQIVNFLKCVANYTFYILGLEVCFCFTILVACIRVDAFSVLYLVLAFVFLFSRRSMCARVWPAYMIFLGLLLIVQYAACTGIPNVLVESLPWDSTDNETISLQRWLFIPSSTYTPNANKLFLDFLQFMMVSLQWRVFKLEQRPDWPEYGAGDNKPILDDSLPGPEDRDFISTKESYLDYLRHGVFYWSYWLSLAIVFATGVSWITLFCLGYMILSFIYLWMGQNVMIRKRASLLASWNVIIGYTFCVILAKCSLQLMGCVYWNRVNNHGICWLIQLFGVTCMNPVGWNDYTPISSSCDNPSNGLHWDVVCFIVITFQRKIFTTNSFRHVVFDLTVQSKFASRGAYLINRKLMQTINLQARREKEDLERVQRKLDKIAARQKELGKNAANLNEHYILIRSGDYYLFEGDPEDDDEECSTFDLKRKSTTPSLSLTSKINSSDEKGLQEVRNRRKSLPSTISSQQQQNMQRQHLKDAWPAIEPSLLDVLSHHTDPYTINGPIKLTNEISTTSNRREKRRRAHEQDPSPSSSETEQLRSVGNQGVQAGGQGRIRPVYASHRRLSSYPETYLARHALRREMVDQEEVIELAQLPSTSSATTGQRRLQRVIRAGARSPHRATSPSTIRPLVSPTAAALTTSASKSHRRIASASAITRSKEPESGRNPTLTFSSSAQPIAKQIELTSSEQQQRQTADRVEASSSGSGEAGPSKPSVSFAGISQQTGSGKRSQQRLLYEEDPGAVADVDDEEDDEDDANPMQTPTSHMNPLQLINQAIEHGAQATVRQYRKNLAAYHQQSMMVGTFDIGTRNRRISFQEDGKASKSFNAMGMRLSLADQRAMPGHRARPLRVSADATDINFSRVSPAKVLKPKQVSCTASIDYDEPCYESDPLLNLSKRDSYNAMDKTTALTDLNDVATLAPVRSDGQCRFHAIGEEFGHVAKEGRWSRFKAGCLICHMFICSTINTTIRLLNGVTREHRRIRRTIDQEKRMVKRRILANIQKSREEARFRGFTEHQTNELVQSVIIHHFKNHFAYRHFYQTPYSKVNIPKPYIGKFVRDAHDQRKHTSRHHSNGSNQNAVATIVAGDATYAPPQAAPMHSTSAHEVPQICKNIHRKVHFKEVRFMDDCHFSPESVNIESVVLDVVYGNQSPARSTNGLEDSTRRFISPPIHGRSSGTLAKPSIHEAAIVGLNDPSFVTGNTSDGEDMREAENMEREQAFRRSRSNFFLLVIAVVNLAVVHSELVCYVILVINHMRSANVLSLVYPLIVFLWAMLSVPRPTKTFWITLITYTEIVIIIKYIFQFRFINFNSDDQLPPSLSKTHWLPAIFGVQKTDTYATWDLIQLLFIFLHRSYLKNHGLWRDDTESRQDLERVVEGNRDMLKKSINSGSGIDDSVREPVPLHGTYSNSQSSNFNPLTKMRRFYLKMTDPRYNCKVDVYVYMFICEFLSFWIIIFGYQSFGPSTGMGDNAFEFIKTNRIPGPFIGMIIIQSLFIIMDRALFLRRQVLGKFIFQIIHVILIHIWLFFLLPQITLKEFGFGFARALLYLVKCVYFALSAYQIRSGYPQNILGNFLTKNYNYINLVLFKAYLITPFLYEVRSVMDWMWTDSPLSLYHWMELEDIYAKVFVMKCWRRSEIEYPTPLGTKRNICTKYTVGLLLLLFALICFWGPLAVGSFIDTTFVINVPVECFQSLAIGGFPTLFSFTSRENDLLPVSNSFIDDIKQCNALDQLTVGFMNNFKWADVSNMTFDSISEEVWTISPPVYMKLMRELTEPNITMRMNFQVKCRRSQKGVVSSAQYVEQHFNRHLTMVERQNFSKILSEMRTPSNTYGEVVQTGVTRVNLNYAFPRFLLANKDSLRNASGKLGWPYTYINISASLHRDNASRQYWWVLQEVGLVGPPCYGSVNNLTETEMNYQSPNRRLSIVTFNERVSDNLIGKIFSSYGIIGMYAAYIFVASRLLRMIYSDISYIISLQELPHVDRLLNLCHDIYLVRENGQLFLEEQLFAKLIFLYRSSETMIKWTRHPKSLVDKFTDKPVNPHQQPPSTQPPPPPPPASASPESQVHHPLATVGGNNGNNSTRWRTSQHRGRPFDHPDNFMDGGGGVSGIGEFPSPQLSYYPGDRSRAGDILRSVQSSPRIVTEGFAMRSPLRGSNTFKTKSRSPRRLGGTSPPLFISKEHRVGGNPQQRPIIPEEGEVVD